MKLKFPVILWAVTFALVLAFAPRAHARPAAQDAAIVDTATTALALHTVPGAMEANPMGFPASIIGKIAILAYMETMTPEERAPVEALASSAWTGAAVNNLLIIAGASTIAMPMGIFTFLVLWLEDENE